MKTKRIKFEQQFYGRTFKVTVEIPEEERMTIYRARYIFLSAMKNNFHLKKFLIQEGRPSEYDKKILEQIKIIQITETTPVKELFKENYMEG